MVTFIFMFDLLLFKYKVSALPTPKWCVVWLQFLLFTSSAIVIGLKIRYPVYLLIYSSLGMPWPIGCQLWVADFYQKYVIWRFEWLQSELYKLSLLLFASLQMDSHSCSERRPPACPTHPNKDRLPKTQVEWEKHNRVGACRVSSCFYRNKVAIRVWKALLNLVRELPSWKLCRAWSCIFKETHIHHGVTPVAGCVDRQHQ